MDFISLSSFSRCALLLPPRSFTFIFGQLCEQLKRTDTRTTTRQRRGIRWTSVSGVAQHHPHSLTVPISLSRSHFPSLCLKHLACIFSDFFFHSFLQTELRFFFCIFMLSERARARLQLWTFRRKRTKRKKIEIEWSAKKKFFARLYMCVWVPPTMAAAHTHTHTQSQLHTLSFSVQVVALTPHSCTSPPTTSGAHPLCGRRCVCPVPSGFFFPVFNFSSCFLSSPLFFVLALLAVAAATSARERIFLRHMERALFLPHSGTKYAQLYLRLKVTMVRILKRKNFRKLFTER